MELIKDTIDQFIQKLETEFESNPGSLKPETSFQEIEDWSSMHALIIIALIDTEYDITVTGEDLKSAETIQDLYNIVKNRLQP